MNILRGTGSWITRGSLPHQIIQERRRAEFITPIPKPKKRKGSGEQLQLFDFEEDDPISSADQRYDLTPIINELRKNVALCEIQWVIEF